MGSVNFNTGFKLGSIKLTKSFCEASSAIVKTEGKTNGTIWGFTNSLAKHGTTLKKKVNKTACEIIRKSRFQTFFVNYLHTYEQILYEAI